MKQRGCWNLFFLIALPIPFFYFGFIFFTSIIWLNNPEFIEQFTEVPDTISRASVQAGVQKSFIVMLISGGAWAYLFFTPRWERQKFEQRKVQLKRQLDDAQIPRGGDRYRSLLEQRFKSKVCVHCGAAHDLGAVNYDVGQWEAYHTAYRDYDDPIYETFDSSYHDDDGQFHESTSQRIIGYRKMQEKTQSLQFVPSKRIKVYVCDTCVSAAVSEKKRGTLKGIAVFLFILVAAAYILTSCVHISVGGGDITGIFKYPVVRIGALIGLLFVLFEVGRSYVAVKPKLERSKFTTEALSVLYPQHKNRIVIEGAPHEKTVSESYPI